MSADPIIEPLISPLIAGQFPQYFRENGPQFVLFLTKYFEWMESPGQALYNSRRLLNYRDIDTTTEDFIIHFKNTYLQDIQLETSTNIRQLIKHSLDVYRAKGTSRAIDLLFRLVFGVGATVYTPSRDIFTLSSGKWVAPIYIEVSLRSDHQRFIGKDIIGLKSGAQAFVERYVRRANAGRVVDVLYLSNLKGNFLFDEIINSSGFTFSSDTLPKITGSLSDLSIIDGGANFEAGDIVDLFSGTTKRGTARVVEVANTTGTVTFTIEDGGYGYGNNSQVIVSDTVVSMSVVPGPSSSQYYFNLFDTLYQKRAIITYTHGSGNIPAGSNLQTYYANGSVMGTGYVYSSLNMDANSGILNVSVRSGNLQSNAIYTTGNVLVANISVPNGYIDQTATANVMSEDDALTITLNASGQTFKVGEELYQIDGSNNFIANATISSVTPAAGALQLGVKKRLGAFTYTQPVLGRASGSTGVITDVTMRVGVVNVTGNFLPGVNAYPFVSSGGVTGIVHTESLGSAAGFTVTNQNLIDTETFAFASDPLSSFSSTQLKGTYPFTRLPGANSSTPLINALTLTNYTIGRLASISGVAPGSNYNVAPFVRVIDQTITSLNKQDYKVYISNSSGSFSAGDIVTQVSTGSRGMVKPQSNATCLFLLRMNVYNTFGVTTSDANTVLVCTDTGSTATVTLVDTTAYSDSGDDIDNNLTGASAVINASSTTSQGALSNVAITDSGFGHTTGEILIAKKDGAIQATVAAVVGTQGVQTGYYASEQGFLSSDKKLFDGDYYQNYSYEVRSAIPFEKYRDMLKNVLHIAGTKAFGALYIATDNPVPCNIEPMVVTRTPHVGTGDLNATDVTDLFTANGSSRSS